MAWTLIHKLKGDKGDPGDPATNLVQSVNAKVGVVVLTGSDIDVSATSNTKLADIVDSFYGVSNNLTTHQSDNNAHGLADVRTDLAYAVGTVGDLISTVDAKAAQSEVTALTAEVATKAPINSPVLTGNPQSPTPATNNVSTSIATCAFVNARIASLINGAPEAFDTLKEISDQLATDESAVASLVTTVAGKLAKASNLSDLTNAATARTNLGLGSAAQAILGTGNGQVPTFGASGVLVLPGNVNIGGNSIVGVNVIQNPDGEIIYNWEGGDNQFFGSFYGDGSALTNVPATVLTGTINNARLPATISITEAINAKTGYFATTTIADSLTIDSTGGGIPGIRARVGGATVGYWAVAAGNGQFLSDASFGDMVFRSESGKVLLGVGTGSSALAITSTEVVANRPVYIANQAVPATPTGGGVIYVEGGALKYKGSSGTVTTLGPA